MNNPLTTVSTIVQTDYEVTKDPFAIFGFALLVTTIFLFLFILLVTARRSSNEVWDSLRRRPQRHRRGSDVEHGQETAVPLMSSDCTGGNASGLVTRPNLKPGPAQALKRVRFSENIESKTIPSAPNVFDEVLDECHEPNTGDCETRTAKRESTSERQFAELCLS